MLTAVKSWPTSVSGKDFEVVLYRVRPDDYPKELYEPWYEDPLYKHLDVKSILVYVGGAGMGDVVMINPLFNALKKAWPESHITWIGGFSNPVKCLLKDNGLIDDVLYTVVRKHRPSAFPEYARWWRDGRRMGEADLFIDTQRQFVPSLLFSLCFKYKHRIGYSSKCFFSDWKFKEPDRHKVHDTFQTLILARRLGIEPPDPLHRILIPENFEQIAGDLWERYGFGEAVAMFPYSARPVKDWNSQYFLSLGRMLLKEGFKVLLFGGPGDFDKLRNLADLMGKGAYVPYLLTDLSIDREMYLSMALLKKAALTVSVDSGGAHLSAALGTKTLVISLLSRVDKFMPVGRQVWSIYPKIDCSPCPDRNMKACGQERWCVKGITPRILYEAATLLLSGEEAEQ
ncbi:heptosyltransferase-2 [Acetomicrobium flavidum]|uniref:Heptosyltransferase-2 n=2 Tax=Acetomicrobium TaxID=49894 RepID=A0ABY1JBR5_9BACT|nr:heptosyltransferase-2 [Acetomicrobium flavidum]